MAEENKQAMDENPASERHWLYGFNSAVLVIAAVVVMVILAVLSQLDVVQKHTKFDWSSSDFDTLSGATHKMLDRIDKKPDQYVIWSLFTDAPDEVKRNQPDEAERQSLKRQRIRDLLDQYKRATPRITWDDRGDASKDDIEKQIRDKYKTEFKAYQDALDAYDPLVDKLSDFLKKEAAAIGAFAQKPDTPPDEARLAAALQAGFEEAPARLVAEQRKLHELVDSTNLPDWGAIKDLILSRVDPIESLFGPLSDADGLKKAMEKKEIPAALGAYFTSANEKYKGIVTELRAYIKQLNDLQPLKVQDVMSKLDRNTVVVLGPNSAKVLTYRQLFADATTSGRSGESGVRFNGEQAISSALLSMTDPNKVKVIFVSPTPQHLLDDMFSDLKEVLEDANFEVLEWSPSASPSPSGPPEGGGPPPASGRGVVWIVFPPDAPSNPMMMMNQPNAGPVIAATRTHLAKGGQVFFLASAGDSFMGSPTYAYAELVKDFGIEVQSKYTVLHGQDARDPNTGENVHRNTPYVGTEQTHSIWYADHDITSQVKGLPTIFGPLQGSQGQQLGRCTVVKVLPPAPKGVEALEVVKTPYIASYWATENPSSTAAFDEKKDRPAPVPLMAVAVKDKGEKAPDGSSDEQRIAVLGAQLLGANAFLEINEVQTNKAGERYLGPSFPGNAELMKNTVLWLSGYENMIAVSARPNRPASIGSVSLEKRVVVSAIVLLAPILSLVCGIIIWIIRRR